MGNISWKKQLALTFLIAALCFAVLGAVFIGYFAAAANESGSGDSPAVGQTEPSEGATLEDVTLEAIDGYTLQNGYYRNADGYYAFTQGMEKSVVEQRLQARLHYSDGFEKTVKWGTDDYGTVVSMSGSPNFGSYPAAVDSLAVDIAFTVKIGGETTSYSDTLNFYKQEYGGLRTVGWTSPSNIETSTRVTFDNLNLAGKVYAIWNNGLDSNAVVLPGELNFDNLSFAPTSDDIKKIIAGTADSYDKTILIKYGGDKEGEIKSLELTVENIKWVKPDRISTEFGGMLGTQTATKELDLSGITINFRYPEIIIPVSLEDIKGYCSWKMYTAKTESEEFETTVVSKQVKLFVITCALELPGMTIQPITEKYYSVTVNPVPIDPPFLEDPVLTYSDLGCSTTLKNLTEEMDVVITDTVGGGASSNASMTREENVVTFTFNRGGDFYVKVTLDPESDYYFASGNQELVSRTEHEVIFKVKVNKAPVTIELNGYSAIREYGDDEPSGISVTGTIINDNQTFTAVKGEISGDQDSTSAPKYQLFYYKSGQTKAQATSVVPKAVGNYFVFARTSETALYQQGEEETAHGFEITKRVISATSSVTSIPFDGEEHTVDEFFNMSRPDGGKVFVYGDTADDVFTIPDKTYTHVNESEDVSLTIKKSDCYVWDNKTGTSSISVTITKLELSFSVSQNGFTYGGTVDGAGRNLNYADLKTGVTGVEIDYSLTEYYKANDDGTKGAKIEDATSEVWNVGKYIAKYYAKTNASLGKNGIAGVDYNEPVCESAFEISRKAVDRVTVTDSGWDLSSGGWIGQYSGSAIEAALNNYNTSNTAPDGSKIITVTATGVRLAPHAAEAISGLENVFNYANGKISLTEAGAYTVTVELNGNYKWSDTPDNGDDIVYYGKIYKKYLTDLTLSDETVYTGNAQNVNVTYSQNGGNNSWTNGILSIKSVLGNSLAANDVSASDVSDENGTFKVTAAGNYAVTVELLDSYNYEWTDNGSTAEERIADRTLNYVVKQAVLSVTWDATAFEYVEGAAKQNTPTPTANVVSSADNGKLSLATTLYSDEYVTPIEGNAITTSGSNFYIRVTAVSGVEGDDVTYLNYALPTQGDALNGISTKFVINAKGLAPVTLTKGAYDFPTTVINGNSVSAVYKHTAYKFSEFIANYNSDYLYENSGKTTYFLEISVDGTAGDPGIKNVKLNGETVISYVVTVRPAKNYKWDIEQEGVTSEDQEFKFTFTVTQLTVELKWSGMETTYGKTQSPSITVSNALSDKVGIDVASLEYEKGGTKYQLASAGTGEYTVTATALTGDDKGNYTLSGCSNLTENFVILKQIVTSPVLTDLVKGVYDGEKTLALFKNLNSLNTELFGATVTAKRPASFFTDGSGDMSFNVSADSFNSETGVFAYSNAGYYYVEFFIKDTANYCWNASQQKDFANTGNYVTSNVNFLQVEQREIYAPVLGGYRAQEWDGGVKPLSDKLTGILNVNGITANYSVAYGEYDKETDWYGEAGNQQAGGVGGKDDVVRGEYFALLTLTENDKYNFVWSFDTSDTGGSSFVEKLYKSSVTHDGGSQIWLHYAVTASQLPVGFKVNGTYVFGSNGAFYGETAIPEDKRVKLGDILVMTGTETDIGYTQVDGVVITYIFSLGGKEICKNELPWNVGVYDVKVTIDFKNSALSETYSELNITTDSVTGNALQVEVTVLKAAIEWSGETSVTYDGLEHTLTAAITNMPRKNADDTTAAPVLTTNKVKNVKYSGNAVASQAITAALPSNETNFTLEGVDNVTAFLTVKPRPVALTGTDVTNHVYGEAVTEKAYTVNSGYSFCETGVEYVTVKILDPDGNEITRLANVGSYRVVPELKNKLGNYILADDDNNSLVTEGTYVVVKRQINVTVNDDADGNTLATSVYGETPKNLNDSKYFTVTTANGTGSGLAQGETAKVFELSHGVTDQSGISTAERKYRITCELLESGNYEWTNAEGFGEFYYVVTPASVYDVVVGGYRGVYDGLSHNVLNVSAKTVNSQELRWKYSLDGSEWFDYTVTDGTANVRIRNVADSKTYYVKVSADNHSDFLWKNAEGNALGVEVKVTPAALSVSVNLTVYFGENGPDLHGANGKWFKETIADLRDKNGIYTVSGLKVTAEINDEDLFYSDDPFYALNASEFTYRYADSYARGDKAGKYALVFEANGLACGNYTFSGAEGFLTVEKLPVTVTLNADYTEAVYGTNPEELTVNYKYMSVSTAAKSKYDGVTDVSIEGLAIDKFVSGISTEALVKKPDGTITTNNVRLPDGYDIIVDVNGENCVWATSAPSAKYLVKKAENGFVTEDYSLFQNGAYSSADGSSAPTAWTYGDFDAVAHPNGYNAEADHAIKDFSLIFGGRPLQIEITLPDGNTVSKEALAGTYKTVLEQMFKELFDGRRLNAGEYRVYLSVVESGNYLEWHCDQYFKVAKQSLTVTPQNLSVVYGEDLEVPSDVTTATGSYTYLHNGLVNHGGRPDELDEVVTFVFSSAYVKGYENGSVGSYSISVKDVSQKALYKNYEITFGEDSYVTVTPRKITVEIVKKANNFDLSVLNADFTYGKEKAKEYSFLLVSGTVYNDELTGENRPDGYKNNEYNNAMQTVFVLSSNAFTPYGGGSYATNGVGDYAVYLTRGAKFEGAQGNANYEISVKNGLNGFDESKGFGVKEEDRASLISTEGYGTFTIEPAPLNIVTGDRYYKDKSGNTAVYESRDPDRSRYDGKYKLYLPYAINSDGGKIDIDITVKYYDKDTNEYLGDGVLPINAGNYTYTCSSADPNYAPQLARQEFEISPRELTYVSVVNYGYSSNVNVENNSYTRFYNAKNYVWTTTFSGLVEGEWLYFTGGLSQDVKPNAATPNVYSFSAKDAEKYVSEITFASNGQEGAANPDNYSFASNSTLTLKFTLNIEKTPVTVSVENVDIQFGTALSANGAAVEGTGETRFAGFTLKYTTSQSVLSSDEFTAMIEADRNNGVLNEKNVSYSSGYNAKTSVVGNSYTVTPSGITDKNLNIGYGPTGSLFVVKRNVTVSLLGTNGGNALATHEYTGKTDHRTLLQGILDKNYDAFLKAVDDVFDARTPNFAELGIKVSFYGSIRVVGTYCIIPNYESANYNVKIVDGKGNEITQGRKQSATPADDADMPTYEITRATLTVTVNENVLIYGNAVDLKNFSLKYSGWKSNNDNVPEGDENGSKLTITTEFAVDGFAVSANGYSAWDSVAGAKFNADPELLLQGNKVTEITNYTIKYVSKEFTVISRPISNDLIEATESEIYKEDGGNYHNGQYGANQDMPVEFHNFAESYYPKYSFKYSYDDGKTFVDAKPNRVGNYIAKVIFETNSQYGRHNYVFEETDCVSNAEKTFPFAITKKLVSFAWDNGNSASITLNPEGDTQNRANFVADIMTIDSFQCAPDSGETFEVTNFVANNAGLTLTLNNLGRYYLTVRFNDNAKNNYKWDENDSAETSMIFFRVVANGNLVYINNLFISDWIYGNTAGLPSAELWYGGSKLEGNFSFAYSYRKISGEFTDTPENRRPQNTNGFTFEKDYSNVLPYSPDSGWYLLRCVYAGNDQYGETVAYYVFNITKKVVATPTIEIVTEGENKNDVYTGARLEANVNYDSAEMTLDCVLDRIGINGGATLFAVDANTYKVTFALKDYSNYEWEKDIALETDKGQLVYVLEWKVDQATDTEITWDTENSVITYGDEFTPQAHTNYRNVYSFSYKVRLEGETKPDMNSGWQTTAFRAAGNYWIKAECMPNSPNYTNSKPTYTKLTINKKELTAFPTASITYGTEFTSELTGRTSADYDFVGFAHVDNKNSITVNRNALRYSLADTSLGTQLHVKAGGYALTFVTEETVVNGVARQTVVGMSSDNYYIVVSGDRTGTLTVNPKSISVRVQPSSSVYNGKTPELDDSNWAISSGAGSLASWDDRTVLNIKLNFVDEDVVNVGSYYVEADDDSTDYNVSYINGIHTVVALQISVVIDAGGGTYGGTIIGASVSQINAVNAVTDIADNLEFTYRYSGNSYGGIYYDSNEVPVLAGSYNVFVSAIKASNKYDKNNFELVLNQGSIGATFVVQKKEIDADKLSVPSQPYTGEKLTPKIVDEFYNVGGAKIYEIVDPESFNFVDRGTYSFALRLLDFANYKWKSVDVEERTLSFTITKAENSLVSDDPNTAPTITIKGWIYGQYEPTVNFPEATVKFGQDKILFYYSTERDGIYTNRIPEDGNAGTYWVKVVVLETDDYARFESEPVSFTIEKRSLAAPSLAFDETNMVYTGDSLLSKVLGYNDQLMGFDYGDGEARVQGGEITIVAVNAGTYKVKVYIKNAVNYRWAEGASLDSDGNVELVWNVARKKVAKPTDNNRALIVNGQLLTYLPNGFDETIMSIRDNRSGYGGEFTAYVGLIDTNNYEWEDGTDGEIPYVWTVVGANTVFIATVCSLAGVTAVLLTVALIQFIRYRKKQQTVTDGGAEEQQNGTSGEVNE